MLHNLEHMKLTWRQIDPFIKNPAPETRVVLLYGPDEGLMRERAAQIGKTIVADLNDPFNAATLAGDALGGNPGLLADEANAISMMGGKRLVRVRGAGDKITPAVKNYLQNPNPDCLVVIEAGELTSRSPLRALCERAANAAALPCYVEDVGAVSKFIKETLAAANLKIDQDAALWLAESVVGDRARARMETEKLVTYMIGHGSTITLGDVMACCGSTGAQEIDNLIYAVSGRDPTRALKAYDQMMGEGEGFVMILRVLQGHFRRFHQTRARMTAGDNLMEAMKALSPPVFFKYEDAFRAHVNAWSDAAIERVLARLLALEAECKKTGAAVETLCGQAIVAIAASRG